MICCQKSCAQRARVHYACILIMVLRGLVCEELFAWLCIHILYIFMYKNNCCQRVDGGGGSIWRDVIPTMRGTHLYMHISNITHREVAAMPNEQRANCYVGIYYSFFFVCGNCKTRNIYIKKMYCA